MSAAPIYRVDDVHSVRYKKSTVFCLFQATEGPWRRRFPDSHKFGNELFGTVERCKESVAYSSLTKI